MESELIRWLESRFQEERIGLAQRHALLLDELRLLVSEASEAPPAPVASEGPMAQPSRPREPHDTADPPSPASQEAEEGSCSPCDVSVKLEEKDGKKKRLGKRATNLKQSLSAEKISRPWWHPDRIIKTFTFEIFFACLIFLQAVTMACEVQYTGLDWGYRLSFEGYDRPAEEVWPAMPVFFQAIEIFFGCLFAIEIVLKVIGLRRACLSDPWNFFDMFLVLMWLADMVIAFPVSSSQLRLIRLARLLRLVRLVRVVRGFDSLIVMTTALQESANGLFWVAVIMLVVELLFALLLNQVLVTMVGQYDFTEREEKLLFEHFGTFPRAMLTMFQVTLGTWVPIARILQETVGPAMNIFTILHKVTIGFACIGVINGVFMQETLRVAQSDDVIMMRDVARRDRLHREKMKAFFDLTDQTGDTMISRSSWKQVMASPNTKQWFAAQGLSI